jgi:Mn-containing catalase
MYANVTAEATGRALAVRLFNMTDDPGMKDMLSFLIARDTMHQQQWLAVLEELGGPTENLPIPNSFPQEQENQRFSYVYFDTRVGNADPLTGRFAEGPSLDGKGEFSIAMAEPFGPEPVLAPPPAEGGAQTEQRSGSGGVVNRVKEAIGLNPS